MGARSRNHTLMSVEKMPLGRNPPAGFGRSAISPSEMTVGHAPKISQSTSTYGKAVNMPGAGRKEDARMVLIDPDSCVLWK